MNPTSKKYRLALFRWFPKQRAFYLLWQLLLLGGVMGGLASSTGAQNIPDATVPVNPTVLPNSNTRPTPRCSPRLQSRRILITGSGGLPPGSRQRISEGAFVVELVTIQPQPQTTEASREPNQTSAQSEMLEATGWAVGPNGEVTLTAEPSLNLPCP